MSYGTVWCRYTNEKLINWDKAGIGSKGNWRNIIVSSLQMLYWNLPQLLFICALVFSVVFNNWKALKNISFLCLKKLLNWAEGMDLYISQIIPIPFSAVTLSKNTLNVIFVHTCTVMLLVPCLKDDVVLFVWWAVSSYFSLPVTVVQVHLGSINLSIYLLAIW